MPISPGFRLGLKQPTVYRNVSFSVPEEFSAKFCEEWLNAALEIDLQTQRTITIIDSGLIGSAQASAANYLRYLLLVHRALLQDLRIPVFESPCVTRIIAKPDATGFYTASIWFPIVNHIDIRIFDHWLSVSAQLIRKVIELRHAPQHLEDYYQKFHQLSLQWQKTIPGAKSTVPILQAAYALGIPFTHLSAGIYLIGWGSQSRQFSRTSNQLDSAIGANASHHKGIAKTLMQANGIPVPKGIIIELDKNPMLSVDELSYPLVTKPVDRDRGEGVTLNITDDIGLRLGIHDAGRFSKNVIIEEEIKGLCHRILVVENRIILVVRRNPRSITGNGQDTIATLVDKANTAIRRLIPMKRLPEFSLDAAALEHLTRMGLDAQYIPQAQEKVTLRPAQSSQWGGDPEDVSANLHPANAKLALKAARLFGLSCAGIDFISQDISVPWYLNGAVINEVNFAPVLGRTHAYQRHGILAYLKSIFPHQGKIPIDVFVGQSLSKAATQRQLKYIRRGKTCYLCIDGRVIDSLGLPVYLADSNSLYQKITQLRIDRSVEAIVVHIDHDTSFDTHGLPFEYLTHLFIGTDQDLSEPMKRIIATLQRHLDSSTMTRCTG